MQSSVRNTLLIGVALGLLIGLGGYTFIYSKGYSYLTNTIAIAALLVNIFERKQEAKNPFYRVVELNDTIDDPAVWGKIFPMQYNQYLRTVDMQRAKYGGFGVTGFDELRPGVGMRPLVKSST